MCDEAVNDCLAALKFIRDWFVTSKMLENFDNTLHANDDTFFWNEDFDKVTIIANQKPGAHLEFSEGRGPNFRKGANQYKTKKKRISVIPGHNFLIIRNYKIRYTYDCR